jgi:hypothetical protein
VEEDEHQQAPPTVALGPAEAHRLTSVEAAGRYFQALHEIFPKREVGTWLWVLSASAAAGPALGYLLAIWNESASFFGKAVFVGPFLAVFLLGYVLWRARLIALTAIPIRFMPWKLLGFVWAWLVKRKRPRFETSWVELLLPSTDQELKKLTLRCRRTVSSFVLTGFVGGTASASMSLFVPGEISIFVRPWLLFWSCLAYGIALSRLARQGYLPTLVLEE